MIFDFKKIPPATWVKVLMLIVVLGVMLMVSDSLLDQAGENSVPSITTVLSEPASAPENGSAASALLSAEASLEKRIQSVLEQIAGVGKVDVSVSLASSPHQEYAVNVKKDQREISEKDEKGGTRMTTEENQDHQMVLVPATSQTAGSPLIVKEVTPEIKGVLVVCEGAKDARVREELTQTVQTVLDIPSYKIKVMPKTSESR